MLASALIRQLFALIAKNGDLEVTVIPDMAPSFRNPVKDVTVHTVKRAKQTFGGSGNFVDPKAVERCRDPALRSEIISEPTVRVMVLR